MKIKIAQLVVQNDIELNRKKIIQEISKCKKDEWIVFPEAILSGYYPHEEVYTRGLKWELIQHYLIEIENLVKERQCHCLIGSASFQNQSWKNSVYVFSYLKEPVRHDKIYLSKLDKKHFNSGESLQCFELQSITFGVLACRELIFPELWSDLKKRGSKIIFHLNNAIQPHDILWKHILITRAIENSVFVISVNNAESPQRLASYVISPSGEILVETMVEKESTMTTTLSLEKVITNLAQREDY